MDAFRYALFAVAEKMKQLLFLFFLFVIIEKMILVSFS